MVTDQTITVVIPTIPPRVEDGRYARAVRSVARQTLQPEAIASAVDCQREGSAATRNRALAKATTTWVAFLDDDDELLPSHLDLLLDQALATSADVVYPGCEVHRDGGFMAHKNHRPEWGRFGHSFDPDLLRRQSYLPVTSLVRAELAHQARFGAPGGSHYDDWGFYLDLLDLGAEFVHIPVRTWIWYHQDGPGGNTSGSPERW